MQNDLTCSILGEAGEPGRQAKNFKRFYENRSAIVSGSVRDA